MKKNQTFLCLILFSISNLFALNKNTSMKELMQNEYEFSLEKTNCWLYCSKGKVDVYSSIKACKVISCDIYENSFIITYIAQASKLYGNPSYQEFDFFEAQKVEVTKDDLMNYENCKLNNKNAVIRVNFNIREKFSTPAMAICNVKIRNAPNLNPDTKVIGKLKKFQDVTLYDVTNEYFETDGLKSKWYKIKLENGQEGWVYGGYVKIYFDEKSKQQLYKAFEKDGAEDTNNQKPIQDNS